MTSETKNLILDAVEVLLAKNGFGSTSLRHTTVKAGVILASSVSYHFGPKEALIRAVFERHIIPMDQGRLERLQQDYPGHEIPLDGLIEAFVEPAITLSADKENGGEVFLRLLRHSYTKSSVMPQKAISKMYGRSLIDSERHSHESCLTCPLMGCIGVCISW